MLPYFYIPFFDKDLTEIDLEEDSSRHIVQVLRIKPGEQIRLTDGKGNLLEAAILDAHKKKCRVKIQERVWRTPLEKKVSIAISLLKNAHRFEWFLEKATEIGVKEIIPLLCERTEKQHFRQDRMQHILVSAMLQSQQAWLPELRPPTPFSQIAAGSDNPHAKKLIAHCEEDQRTPILEAMPTTDAPGSCLILIGPEGDFSQKEIALAKERGFIPVSLGDTRLRSETAGMVAAALLCVGE
jgi:16S rRNA (uracil1498-N3)-methyltransferase